MIDTDIRNLLKAEIMSLTDEQVEYVIRMLHDVQNEMSINEFAGKVDSIECDRHTIPLHRRGTPRRRTF